jgi:intracellular sulfur oxidation DsrE/DsrF family protein
MTPDQLAESLLNLKKEQFIQEAEFTPSGVARIAKLQKQGAAYIKP